jgi:DNA-binding transcriptional MerR regulator
LGRDKGKRTAKLHYRIGEAAALIGVEPHVLRYWESEFPTIRPQKARSGQRVYSRKDVERLSLIKELLYSQRFTIAGARQRLRELATEPESPPHAEQECLAAVALLRATLASARDKASALLAEVESAALPRA